ncbi:hypothetical protein ACFLR3_02920 [Campylobacterota bacterium]
MRRIENIEEAAIACAKGEEVCFVVTSKNPTSLFTFCYYQLKHKTTNDFRCIIYQRPKDLLYYFLSVISRLFSWRYTLIYEEVCDR